MSRTIPVTLIGAAAPRHWRDVLEAHATVQDLWDWMLASSPPRDIRDVVVQDESTRDVIVELEPGAFAAYDVT
jgi:hypothetical protein